MTDRPGSCSPTRCCRSLPGRAPSPGTPRWTPDWTGSTTTAGGPALSRRPRRPRPARPGLLRPPVPAVSGQRPLARPAATAGPPDCARADHQGGLRLPVVDLGPGLPPGAARRQPRLPDGGAGHNAYQDRPAAFLATVRGFLIGRSLRSRRGRTPRSLRATRDRASNSRVSRPRRRSSPEAGRSRRSGRGPGAPARPFLGGQPHGDRHFPGLEPGQLTVQVLDGVYAPLAPPARRSRSARSL